MGIIRELYEEAEKKHDLADTLYDTREAIGGVMYDKLEQEGIPFNYTSILEIVETELTKLLDTKFYKNIKERGDIIQWEERP